MWLDDVTLGDTPPTGTIASVSPGRHRLRVRQANREAEIVLSVKPKQVTSVTAQVSGNQLLLGTQDLDPDATTPTSAAPAIQQTLQTAQGTQPSKGRPMVVWLPLVLLGSGGVVLGLPVVLAGLAVTGVCAAAFTMLPRSQNGAYLPLSWESGQMAQVRMVLMAVALAGGLATPLMGLVMGAVGQGWRALESHCAELVQHTNPVRLIDASSSEQPPAPRRTGAGGNRQ